ncbi:MAG: VPLPA-CTERM sorting domain-containing protein [Pseudomonadota bacterium]
MGLRSHALVVLIAVMSFAPATAATLSITGGTSAALPDNYDPAPELDRASVQALTGSNQITVFESAVNGGAIGGGVAADDLVSMRFTFLGKEAAATNYLYVTDRDDTQKSLDNLGAKGSFVEAVSKTGYLGFSFETIHNRRVGSGHIANGGLSSAQSMKLAFSDIFNDGKSVLIFLGDGRGDSDFDDMVLRLDVEHIPHAPLPAAGILMVAGIGALAAMRRLRRKS